jgi:hypothetical protein
VLARRICAARAARARAPPARALPAWSASDEKSTFSTSELNDANMASD